jgi:alpha-tubulin suppressor-like RCC1 family protein
MYSRVPRILLPLMSLAAWFSGCTDGDSKSRTTVSELVSGTFSNVSTGRSFACGIRSNDGALFCWGFNNNGQLGLGSAQLGVDQALPQRVGTASWSAIGTGGRHACGISAGALYCWGANNRGQLGTGSTTSQVVPTRVGSAADWATIAAGNEHTCGVRRVTPASAGALYCWGNGSLGQVGHNVLTDATTPVAIGTAGDWSKVALGGSHSCALTTGGALHCWGANQAGQLGAAGGTRTTPLAIGAELHASLSTGENHTCATRNDGSLYCWGSINNSTTPGRIGAANDWTSVAAGSGHSCGLRGVGELWCFGANNGGQLGLPETAHQPSPARIGGSTDWTQLAASLGTCGIHTNGQLECWGPNARGELGHGIFANKAAPVAAGTTRRWGSVSSGGYHTCAIKLDGTLHCFGQGWSGQLGDGSATYNRHSPNRVGALSSWEQISSGLRHTCGLVEDGTLYCWGSNARGQVGSGSSFAQTSSPLNIAGVWANVSSGHNHSCAVRTDNTLWCWGQNDYGQLGDGTRTDRSMPVQVAANVSRVAAGQTHTCTLDQAGIVRCFGRNHLGQLGLGTTADALAPQPIVDAASYLQLGLGANHSCGVTTTGDLKCWGNNDGGQLGAPLSTRSLSTPARVDQQNDWSQVTGGNQHTCGLRGTAAFCFGNNGFGQLGDNTRTTRIAPVAIASLPSGWSSLSAGLSNTCGVQVNGYDARLLCWGDNAFGQLGDGAAWSVSVLDECATAAHNCSADATCLDAEPSFACVCNTGYSGNGVTCEDVDECGTSAGCHSSEVCTNFPGGRACSCPAGHAYAGGVCVDVDECATNQGGCHADAACTNTTGSFSCACNAGYEGDGTSCTEIDECAVNPEICGAHATCTSLPGSHRCDCDGGWQWNGFECVDVDECSDPIACGSSVLNYQCQNTPGAFECACIATRSDCDGLPENGCETNIASLASCGSCGNACPVSTYALCISGECTTIYQTDYERPFSAAPPTSGAGLVDRATDFIPLVFNLVLIGDLNNNRLVLRYVDRAIGEAANYPLPAPPGELLLDEDRGFVYVALGSAGLARVQLDTLVVTHMSNVPSFELALGNDGRVFATMSSGSLPAIAVIDGPNAQVLGTTLNSSATPFDRQITFDRTHDSLLTSRTSTKRFQFDPVALTFTEEERVTEASSIIHELVLSPDGAHVARVGAQSAIPARSPESLANSAGAFILPPTIEGYAQIGTDAQFSLDGTLLIVGTSQQRIELFDGNSFIHLGGFATPPCPFGPVTTVTDVGLSRGNRTAFAYLSCGTSAYNHVYYVDLVP